MVEYAGTNGLPSAATPRAVRSRSMAGPMLVEDRTSQVCAGSLAAIPTADGSLLPGFNLIVSLWAV